MLRTTILDNDLRRLANVNTPHLMHAYLGRCRLTSQNVIFPMHTCYAIACRPLPMCSAVSQCAQATTDVAPWCTHTTFDACGPSRVSPYVCGRHFPYAHVWCVREMIGVVCRSVMPLWCPHAMSYVCSTRSLFRLFWLRAVGIIFK